MTTKYLKDQLQGFVPTEIAAGIMDEVAKGSTIMQMSDVQEMKSDKKQYQVWAEKPGAYWVGESERIKTSVAKWIFPVMEAKKMAVIIPVTKEKLDDTTIDVFNELKPQIAEAFYTTLDAACMFGTDSPFAKNIFKSATDASNVFTRTEASLDLDVNEVMGLVEESDLDVNGFVAPVAMKKQMRGLRDGNGNQLAVFGTSQNSFYDLPISISKGGAFDKTKAELIAADWSKSLLGIRDNIEFEVLKEATLHSVTMEDGKPLSLAENDMIGIKATFRVGYLPIKDDAFAVLKPKVSGLALNFEDKEVVNLNNLRVDELKVMAKEKGLEGYSTMTKGELIELIESV